MTAPWWRWQRVSAVTSLGGSCFVSGWARTSARTSVSGVTSPARTLLDIAPRLNERALTRAVNDLRVARFLRLNALAELLDRCGRHPGAPRLAPFVEAPTNGTTRSEFEDAFVAFTHRYGLPTPQINAPVAGRIVDALFEAERVIVELDSFEYHSSKDAFEGDRDRDVDHLVARLQTVRITWPRLTGDPGREAQRLEAILRHRGKTAREPEIGRPANPPLAFATSRARDSARSGAPPLKRQKERPWRASSSRHRLRRTVDRRRPRFRSRIRQPES